MADDKSPDEPFDPYAPPPPGQQPYGRPPEGQPYGQPPYRQPPQGQGAPGHGYYYPQGYNTAYEPPPKKSSLPLWLGALLGLVGVFGLLFSPLVNPDLFPWLTLGALVVLIVLFVVPETRRWGLGVLIGVALSIPIGLIIFAGICIALIANSSQTSQ